MTNVKLMFMAATKNAPRRADIEMHNHPARAPQCQSLSPTGQDCFLDVGHRSLLHKHGWTETWAA